MRRLVVLFLACVPQKTVDAVPRVTDASTHTATVSFDAGLDAITEDVMLAALVDADTDADPFANDDPMLLHKETREDLVALFELRTFQPFELKTMRPDLFLILNIGPVPTRMNQGNKGIAHHGIGQKRCEHSTSGMIFQTDEQRKKCGAPNMVPIYRKGDMQTAAYCIDVFEFPNKPCALPFVWAAPTHAQTLCALQGKRLCTQNEWAFACRGDPAGGADRSYAYGNDLDLQVCNTNKPRGPQSKCDARTLQGAWDTCTTDTEPSGSFPQCRSRFGVFDQHGNVAEVMTRMESDGTLVSQLKGSAFFYAQVARKPNEYQGQGAETYPDNCNHDPRWHIEPMDKAWHVNYHLGFRCCKSVTPGK